MILRFTDRQISILKSALKGTDFENRMGHILSGNLKSEEIDEVCFLLSGEFHAHGIDQNFEATSYGKEVEAVLDIVNHPRLVK